MRGQIEAFVDSAAEAFELQGPVYQLWSGPREDSGARTSLRESFPEAAYVGFELEGVAEIDRLPLSDGAAQTVLCVDVPEYAFHSKRAVEEMTRILSPGGALLVCASAAGGVPEQAPGYWRLTPRSVERLLSGMAATLVGWQGGDAFAHTIYGVGFKRPVPRTVLQGTSRFLDCFQARLDEVAGGIGWPRRLKRFLRTWAGSRSVHQQRRDYYKVQFAVHLGVDRDRQYDLLQSCLSCGKTGARLDLMD